MTNPLETKKLNEKRRLNLKTPRDSRRIISRYLNELDRDIITPEKARAVSTLINTFNKSYEVSENDRKLNELETIVKNFHN